MELINNIQPKVAGPLGRHPRLLVIHRVSLKGFASSVKHQVAPSAIIIGLDGGLYHKTAFAPI